MLPFSPARVSRQVVPVRSAVTTSGGGGAGVGEGVGTGVAVGPRVGRAVGVAGLDPHAARPTAAMAVPMMVSFMSPFTHSTGTRPPRLHPRKCVERPPRFASVLIQPRRTLDDSRRRPPKDVPPSTRVAVACSLHSPPHAQG